MEDNPANSDLLEDEELASLRLAALATLKHKKQSTIVTPASENTVPDNSSTNISINIVEAEPSQIPFHQSDRNSHNNSYSWRKQSQISRRRGSAFPKTSHRSNLIVISPVSLDDSKGSDEKPAPALVLPQHKWCNSGNEDSMSPKTLRRTGPTRFNRHGSDSESSDSDYENSDNDSGSNETVLQDEPQEHFSRASPENQKDIVPENVEKQRRLSFQNLETDIKTDAFDKNETTSVYNCLKKSASYSYTDNRSDNYPLSQNQSDDKHSWTYSVEKEYSTHKPYSSSHSYSAEMSDPSGISGKRRNSSHVSNGESCVDGVASYAAHVTEPSSWQHPGLESGNSYYTQESVSESARNQGSGTSVWQHGQERLRTNNQYFTRDAPYNNVDSHGFVGNDILSYSDSKNHPLSQNDLRRELKRIQEYKGHDNQNETVDNRRHADNWDNNRQRFPHREDRNAKDGNSYQFRNRQEGNSGRQRSRHTRSFSRERIQTEYSSNFHRRRHERSASPDRNRQERSSSRDRIRHKHVSERNRYDNSLNRYDRNSSQDRSKRGHSSSEERNKRECSFSHDESELERSFTKERQKGDRSTSEDRNKPEHSTDKGKNKHEFSSIRDRSKKEHGSSHGRSSHERSISQEKSRHDHSTSRERSTSERSFSRERSRYQRSSSRDRNRRGRSSSRSRSRRGRSSSRTRYRRRRSSSRERKRDDRSSSHERRRDEHSSSREKDRRGRSSSRRRHMRSASRDRSRHERSSSRNRHEHSPSHSRGKQDSSSSQIKEEYSSSKNKKEHSPLLDRSDKDQSFNSEKNKDLHSSPERVKQEITSVLQRNQHLIGLNQEKPRQENTVNVQQLARSTERKRQKRSKSEETYKEQSSSPLPRQSRRSSAKDKEYHSRSRSRSSSGFSSSSSGSSSSHSSRPKIRSVPSVIKSVQSKSSDSGTKTFNDSKSAGKRSRSSSLSDCNTSPMKKRLLIDTADHNKLSIAKNNRIDGDLKNASDGNKRVPVHMRLGAFPRKRVIQMTKDVEAAFVNSSSSSDGESVSTKSKRPNIRIFTDVYDSKNVLDNEKKHHSGKDKFEKKSPDTFREKSRRVKTQR